MEAVLVELRDLAESCRGSGGTISLSAAHADFLGARGQKTTTGGMVVNCADLVRAVDAHVRIAVNKDAQNPELPKVAVIPLPNPEPTAVEALGGPALAPLGIVPPHAVPPLMPTPAKDAPLVPPVSIPATATLPVPGNNPGDEPPPSGGNKAVSEQSPENLAGKTEGTGEANLGEAGKTEGGDDKNKGKPPKK